LAVLAVQLQDIEKEKKTLKRHGGHGSRLIWDGKMTDYEDRHTKEQHIEQQRSNTSPQACEWSFAYGSHWGYRTWRDVDVGYWIH
jgi:hypothetical protein